jgi:alkylation response protein AidB-like acyl-CoA dehydrogenase
MDFTLTDEQRQLQETLSRYVAREYDFAQRRETERSAVGMSGAHWKAFADLGLLALTVPAAYGGLDGSAIDTMIVMEELGRGLVLEPYWASAVVCGGLVADAAVEAQKEALLPSLAAGELILALAHHEPGVRYETSSVATTALVAGNGFVLEGSKSVVFAGPHAQRLIVSARTSGTTRERSGISLFVVDRGATGIEVRGYPTQDGMRAADVLLSGVRVGADAMLGAPGEALPVIERALERGIAALCAEAVGIMTALNAATLDHLKTREQFGGPIGRFQVLQHRMVDMFIAAEQARSITIKASVDVESADPQRRRHSTSMAKALVGQAARLVGQQAVQTHGGMGVTDELVVSHYFKRLTAINATLGDADHHLAIVSDLLVAA